MIAIPFHYVPESKALGFNRVADEATVKAREPHLMATNVRDRSMEREVTLQDVVDLAGRLRHHLGKNRELKNDLVMLCRFVGMSDDELRGVKAEAEGGEEQGH